MIKRAYWQGFSDECRRRGVSPRMLIKFAQTNDAYEAFLEKQEELAKTLPRSTSEVREWGSATPSSTYPIDEEFAEGLNASLLGGHNKYWRGGGISGSLAGAYDNFHGTLAETPKIGPYLPSTNTFWQAIGGLPSGGTHRGKTFSDAVDSFAPTVDPNVSNWPVYNPQATQVSNYPHPGSTWDAFYGTGIPTDEMTEADHIARSQAKMGRLGSNILQSVYGSNPYVNMDHLNMYDFRTGLPAVLGINDWQIGGKDPAMFDAYLRGELPAPYGPLARMGTQIVMDDEGYSESDRSRDGKGSLLQEAIAPQFRVPEQMLADYVNARKTMTTQEAFAEMKRLGYSDKEIYNLIWQQRRGLQFANNNSRNKYEFHV